MLRVRCGNLYGVGMIEKGLTTLSLSRRFMVAIQQYFADVRFDLLVYPTPPITFAPLVRRLKLKHGCGTYLILRDIFPQNARDLGMIKDPLTFWYFRRKERQLYQASDFIGCMSSGNMAYVSKMNRIKPEKLEILYNWERVSSLPVSSPRDIRIKYGLGDKYVAVFGGNLGPAQGLEFLLKLAREYRDQEDIVFLIIGKGAAKARLQKIVAEERLDRIVIMKDFVPREEFNSLLQACNVGMINLDGRFTIPNIPSKVLAYFSAELPVLAAIDRNTDFGAMLDEYGAGLWSITGDLATYQRNFERLKHDADLRRQLGRNGRRALLEHFTVKRAFDTIIRHWSTEPGEEKSAQS